jgi:DNA-binding CsgD family transcriptional regulator
MRASYDLSAFTEEVGRVEDLGALWSTMVGFYSAAGFGGTCYIVFSRGRPGEVAILLQHGFPPAITDAFVELGYGKDDPNFRYVLETGRPGLRSRVGHFIQLKREEKKVVAALKELNHSDTLALPVFGPNSYVGIVAVGLANAPTFEQSNWTELQLAAQCAHIRGFNLQPEGVIASHNLSPREVEVLSWVAKGKSNNVIAEILSVAPTTVDTYLRRVFDKLGVADRTTAAVRGVGMGLIQA